MKRLDRLRLLGAALLLAAGCAGAAEDAALCPVPTAQALYPGDGPVNPYGELAEADRCVAGAHDAIIVLGCPSRPDGSPADCQITRADLAASLFRAGLGRQLITTGGAVQNRHVEAEALRDLLVARGVPAAAVLLEPRAEHTDENIYYSSLLMEARGWDDALVVSDDPGHLVSTAVCDSNCCVRRGRLTVVTLPLALAEGGAEAPWAVGHYVLYPAAAAVTDAECAHVTLPGKYLCLNLPTRRACSGRLQLP
jgi:hypothetical protein